MGTVGRIRRRLHRLLNNEHGQGSAARARNRRTGGGRGKRGGHLLLVVTAGLIACAALGVGVARAWHADGVTLEAVCDSHSGTYRISATIQQSKDWPGAVVQSIIPDSFPGDTSGEQSVKVKIGWESSQDTQTFTETVTLGGDCKGGHGEPAGTLTVIKHVVNDNGGEAAAGDWTMHVSGPTSLSFAGAENPGASNSIPAGDYTVTESGGPSGYALTYSGDCDASGHVTVPAFHDATCVLTNDDVRRHLEKGSISVSKSVDPTSIKEPGGPVTFSVTITNTSADVNVTITNVVDDKFGDLDDDGGNGCFDVPINMVPGEKVNCTFQKTITGVGGTSHVDTVTASGHDEAGNPVSASDDAKVDITPRLIDLVIVKDATSPTALNGIVNYTMTVTNKGPDTATNVQLTDPAPAGITYLTANPSQGTCNVTPVLITCSLGSIAAGQTVTINVTARATTVGSHTNTATVTGGGGGETNPADNVDSAVTIVPAPIKPPSPKPQPKPQPCLALTVTPKMIEADGKPDRIVAKVTAGGKAVKGAKVLVQGAGVRERGRTNAKGIVVIRINPKKAGLITITTPETQRSCGPRRIGVVGVFLPPLTG